MKASEIANFACLNMQKWVKRYFITYRILLSSRGSNELMGNKKRRVVTLLLCYYPFVGVGFISPRRDGKRSRHAGR